MSELSPNYVVPPGMVLVPAGSMVMQPSPMVDPETATDTLRRVLETAVKRGSHMGVDEIAALLAWVNHVADVGHLPAAAPEITVENAAPVVPNPNPI